MLQRMYTELVDRHFPFALSHSGFRLFTLVIRGSGPQLFLQIPLLSVLGVKVQEPREQPSVGFSGIDSIM